MGRYEMKAIKGMHDVRIKAAAAAAALFLCVGPMGCLTVYADPAYTEGSWMSDSRGSWYQHADGSYKKNGWEYIDGYFYYFDREGYLVRNCLIADRGHMFIADQDGRMLKNVSIDFLGSSYVIDDNGYAVTADIYYQSQGIEPDVQQGTGTSSVQGWRSDQRGSWYVKADGSYAVSAWENINGIWYYFDEEGYMAVDRIQAFHDGQLRYLGSGGIPQTSVEVSYDGVDYTVDENGIARAKEPPKSENELAAESYAANIVSQITNGGMSKSQKANAIYNWLRANMRYTTSGPQSDEAYSALYGFRRRSGCCYEYYAMAHYMLEAAGMPNIPVVRASDHGHYWNLVNVDGVWYHFDATPRRTGGRWCLVTTDYLRRNSWGSHNFDVGAYPATP